MSVNNTAQALASLDLRSEDLIRDPYPYYDFLRRHAPVHHAEELGMWLVTRHDLVQQVLTETHRFGKTWPRGTEPDLTIVADGPDLPESMLDSDPPVHTRLRRLVTPFFSSSAVERLAPRIQSVVDEILNDLGDRDRFDIVSEFALPLPIRVISNLLGLPSPDFQLFRGWTEAYVRSFDVTQGDEVRETGARAHQALANYFTQVVRDRGAMALDTRPEDLLTHLVNAHEQQDRLSESEIVAMCILLLFAGYETTFTLIANGTRLLLLHDDAREEFLANPDRRKAACDEFMRFESPVQRTGYITQIETELGGVTLHPGDIVLAGLGAANRDPDVFPNPDRLDLSRNTSRHLALGRGIHYCIGGPLAILEGSIAISALLERFPSLQLESETAAWAPTSAHRRLVALPVRVSKTDRA